MSLFLPFLSYCLFTERSIAWEREKGGETSGGKGYKSFPCILIL